MWAADRTDVQLAATTPALGPTVPSLIVTVNRVDQFLSNTGSFTGSFTGTFTGSLLGTAATASYYQETDPIFTSKSASLATTGSNNFTGNQTITGSLIHGLEGNIATGEYSHAEGSITKAIGDYSHAEGDNTQAKGNYSHAEGQETMTLASAEYSHAEGYGTTASAKWQHVQGQWNATSSIESAFIVGNGTDNDNRSNLIHAAGNEVQITGSLLVSQSGIIVTGSVASTKGFTGSLFGTSSWADNALTASYVNNGVSFVGSGSIITGSVAISASYGLLVPANTFTVGDMVKIQGVFTKPNAASATSFLLYVNTSNTLSGATQLGIYNTTTTRWNPITRTLSIESPTSTTLHTTTLSTYNDDIVATTAAVRASVNINWGVNQYILFTAQNASLVDRTDSFRFYAKKI